LNQLWKLLPNELTRKEAIEVAIEHNIEISPSTIETWLNDKLYFNYENGIYTKVSYEIQT
jgi:hypothetical protein